MRVSTTFVDLPSELALPVAHKEELLQNQPLVGLPAHLGSVEKPTDHDTRTSRTGRIIKPPTAFTPAPAVVAPSSGKRKGASRKKEANVVCIHCNRGQSPATNAIVFCDGCNDTWHQKCHDPPIDNQVILVKDMEWYCRKCKPVPRPSMANSKPAKVQKSGRILHPRLQAAPRLEVGGDQFTADERRAYLSSLSHAQLVELLVNVSNKNPSVPMFPAGMKDMPASRFTFLLASNGIATPSTLVQTSTPTLNKRSCADEDPSDADLTTNPRKRFRTTSAPAKASTNTAPPKANAVASTKINAAINGISAFVEASASIQSTNGLETPSTNGSLRQSSTSFVSRDTTPEELDPDTEDDVFEDAIEDYRLYPRAGNGFLPSLDDLAILAESPNSHTFSHSVYGPAKTTNSAGPSARIWGWPRQK
ncbi:uncharacterized protein N7482_008537 [Penicillium canariense]|uniref:PHD-type domain-containing protein n=1 Tax=Penicillium canariense TaxID=189055 RepID=A0A9W9LIU7_9EURO|nr:uncharacterized protein N7482_008537 [Penicillium canariense]KAJ5157437.1 hypothetical protein N7482_008537 [Penicillium canariense]